MHYFLRFFFFISGLLQEGTFLFLCLNGYGRVQLKIKKVGIFLVSAMEPTYLRSKSLRINAHNFALAKFHYNEDGSLSY